MSDTDSQQILETIRLHQEGWLDKLQLALDVVGFEPTVGTAADASNAVISALRAGSAVAKGEGDLAKQHTIDAGISAISMVPFGDVVKLFKLRKGRRIAMKGARAVKARQKKEKQDRIRKGSKSWAQEQHWDEPMNATARRARKLAKQLDKPIPSRKELTPVQQKKAAARAAASRELQNRPNQRKAVAQRFGSDFTSKRLDNSSTRDLSTFKKFFEGCLTEGLVIRDPEWSEFITEWNKLVDSWPTDELQAHNKHIFKIIVKEATKREQQDKFGKITGPDMTLYFSPVQKLDIGSGKEKGPSGVSVVEQYIADDRLRGYIINDADIEQIEDFWTSEKVEEQGEEGGTPKWMRRRPKQKAKYHKKKSGRPFNRNKQRGTPEVPNPDKIWPSGGFR